MAKKIFTDESLATFVDETKSYVDSAVSNKADTNHNHDSKYDAKGSANTALESANSYTNNVMETFGQAFEGSISVIYGNDEYGSSIREIANDESNKVQTNLDSHASNTSLHFTTAEKTKLSGVESGAQKNTITGVKGNSESSYRTGNVNITKSNIGLGNVDNTSDANKPVSTAQQTAIDNSLSSAKSYTDTKISNLINSAPTTLDTLGEIATAMAENEDVVEALESAVGNKVDKVSGKGLSTNDLTATLKSNYDTAYSHVSNKSNPHGVTLSQLGVNATAAELNYVDGVTSSIQTQLDGKSASDHTHSTYVNQNAFSNVKVGNTTVAADTATDTLTFEAGDNITITPDATNDKITISATDTIYSTALGLGKTSDNKIYNTGVISIGTGTNNGTITVDKGTSSTGATPIEVKVKGLGSAAYTESSAYAKASHGNHVPTTQTANNKIFLRNDNTWATVTPANIGAAATSHTHTVSNISDLTATATELNYMDGVTSNIQTQLDGKAASTHYHNALYYSSDSSNVRAVWIKDGETGNYFLRPDQMPSDGSVNLGSSSYLWNKGYFGTVVTTDITAPADSGLFLATTSNYCIQFGTNDAYGMSYDYSTGLQLDVGNIVVDNGSVTANQVISTDARIKCLPSYETTVSSATNAYIGTSGYFSRTTSTSSRTIKHDIKELENDDLLAENLYDINVYQFKYDDGIITDTEDCRYGKDLVGFIIEELNEQYPIAVDRTSDDVKEWSWNPRYLIPPMLKLIQDQKKQINDLENRLSVIEEKLAE